MEMRPVETWELAELREQAAAERDALVAAELARGPAVRRARRRPERARRGAGWLRGLRASAPPWPTAQQPHRTA